MQSEGMEIDLIPDEEGNQHAIGGDGGQQRYSSII